jgi:hypothetical protein
MQADHSRRQSFYRAIDGCYVQFRKSLYTVCFLSVVPPAGVSYHWNVGTIELKHEASVYDRPIFFCHGIADSP